MNARPPFFVVRKLNGPGGRAKTSDTMSRFHDDLRKEETLGTFLSEQYRLANLKIQRIADKNLQMRGIDLILADEKGLQFKVDEKAQLHYLNKDLPTFALEINYLKGDKLLDGWLFDPKKLTEIYAFVFSIHLADGLLELAKADDIHSCEVVFVNRIRLLTELAELDLNLKTCRENSRALRQEGGGPKIAHPSGFNFQVSNHLAERPVNLVVRRAFLEKIGRCFSFKRG